MKFIKNILAATVLLTASTVLADANHNDYDSGYYEDEGALLFKIRGSYINAPSKLSKFPKGNVGAERPGNLVQNGYGFDTATTYFFTDSLAAELSLGINVLRVKSTSLEKAGTAFGNNPEKAGKNNEILFVPLAATVQYHMARFGGISPYIGGGYHGAYMYTRSKAIKVDPGHGPVLQAGIDFVAKDDTIFTFDVRQYFLTSKLKFKKQYLGTASDLSSKVDWNPLVISAGIGFKF